MFNTVIKRHVAFGMYVGEDITMRLLTDKITNQID